VVSTHLGVKDLKSLLDETKAVLQYDLALLKPKKGIIYEGDALKPPVTEEELMAKAKEGMESTGGKVLKIEKISLKDGDWIYLGKVDFGTSRKTSFQNWRVVEPSVISVTIPSSSIHLIPKGR